jgi:putative transposase
VKPRPDYLPRLAPEFYQGDAAVHWTLTVFDRGTGWLNTVFHSAFRELMLHVAAREGLFCPAYCLMPDHLHLLWLGLRRDTNQRNGMSFLRTHLEMRLSPHKFQPQAHDHVLRQAERESGAFAKICFYILANPVRAGLVAAGDSRGRREESRLVTSAPTENGRGRRKESRLVTSAPTEWPYAGAIIPGYPSLAPWKDDFWPKFWCLFQQQRQLDAGERELPLRSSLKIQ